MIILSSAFSDSDSIPEKYSCDGQDVNPELTLEAIPEGTVSLALIVDDPDAPNGDWVHWVLYDMPVLARIEENSIPGTQGMNSFGKLDYGGPCPPSGTHRYFFRLYALNTTLGLPEGVDKKGLKEKMEGHIIEYAELMGTYQR
jgi:hypothetical protein